MPEKLPRSSEFVRGNGADQLAASDILARVIANHPGDRISIQDLIDALGERSIGPLILMFALPCIVAPPGLSSFPALPLFLFGAQGLLRHRKAWLPRTLAQQEFAKADIELVFRATLPVILRMERWCRPRMSFLIGSLAERLLGLLVILHAGIIVLPGPGTNGPPGIATVFLSVAVIEKDGLLFFVGVVGSFVALYLGVWGLMLFFQWIASPVL